jgi:hypothetical protein
MTAERKAYLCGRDAAKRGQVTLDAAVTKCSYVSFEGLFYTGAADFLLNRHLELA